jgi:hypothetical protein
MLAAGVGCANNPSDDCGGSVLLLWPTAAGDFKFREIQLPTLKSPTELKGAAAEVYYDARITERGYEGPVARPSLTRTNGNVCVPMDAQSSMALTTYAHVERLYFFDQKLNVADQLSWPRKVGVDIRLLGGEGISHSNAHYFARIDAMAVVPYRQEGLPLSLNPGIIAHEHFHAHFQSQVNNPINQAIASVISIEEFFYAGFFGNKPTVEELEARPQSVEALNKFVIRSWNEGLADFYGAVYSQQADFFSASLQKLGPLRDLAGPLQLLKTGQELVRQAGSFDPAQRSIVSTSYQQGTLLARLMYKIVQSGSVSSEDLLKMILQRLSKISDMASPIFATRVMDFEDAVPLLIEGVKLNAEGCKAASSALSKSVMLRSFPQCAL